jgi:hypothetical protein
MIQAPAPLDRVHGCVGDASARLLTMPAAVSALADDDDLLDSWLASLSVDEFERFLRGLADLR